MFSKIFVVLLGLFHLLAADYLDFGSHFRRDIDSSHAKNKHMSIYHLRVISDIRSRFATTFVNSHIVNRHSEALEATFAFTLPNTAYISNFSLTVGNETYVASVKEKKKAEEEYRTAQMSGVSAAHVYKSPREMNMFQVDVNVAAESKVIFNLTYQEILTRTHGVYKHTVNIDPGQVVDDLSIEVNILEQTRITALKVPKFGAKVGEKDNANLLKMKMNERDAIVTQVITSEFSTVNIKYSPSADKQKNSSSNGFMSGQFVVLYDVDRSFSAGEVQVVNGYFVHFFAPQQIPTGSKHVVFVLDRSGSMQGTKLAQMKSAMRIILSSLEPKLDIFNILTFAGDIEVWKSHSVLTTSRSTEEAAEYVESIEAVGGTNIKDSIKRGIELLQANERPVLSSYLIFLTDGQPTVGEIRVDAILSSIRSINPANKFIIHSIGFGNDVDFNLLKKISIQNSGVPRKVYEDLDTIEQLTGFFQEVSSPLLANVSISYLDESAVDIIQPSSHLYYRGGEMLVVGRLSNANQNVFKAEITATSNNGPERFGIETVFRRIPFPVPDFSIATTTERVPLPAQSLGGFVERMWAYSTIKILLEMATTDPLSQADVEASRQKALHLSLKYNFVTDVTSMVVTLPDRLKPTKPQKFLQEEAPSSNSHSSAAGHGNVRVMSSMKSMSSSMGHRAPYAMSAHVAGTLPLNIDTMSMDDIDSGPPGPEAPRATTTTLPPTTTTAFPCTVNETFNSCGNHCDKKCGHKSPKCRKICDPPACACKKHFYRNSTGHCVLKRDCPQNCGENEEYKECTNACVQKTCANDSPRICLQVCEPAKCECKKGFLLDESRRKCVLPADCPADVVFFAL